MPIFLLGKPDVETLKLNEEREEAGTWDDRENGIDDTLKNIQSSTRNCTQCDYPAPNWRQSCRVCGFHFGRVKNA